MYAKVINNIFNQVFFFQFFSSILVLCTSAYYLGSENICDLTVYDRQNNHYLNTTYAKACALLKSATQV